MVNEFVPHISLKTLTSKVFSGRGEERKNFYLREMVIPFRPPPERQTSQSLSSSFCKAKLEVFIDLFEQEAFIPYHFHLSTSM